MQQEQLIAALKAAQEREDKRAAEAAIESQVRPLSAVFDRSAAYTNFIVLSGYAGFFGLWQLTKEYLSERTALWSALLVLISVVTFVVVEVVKMVLVQHNIMEKAKALKRPEVLCNPRELERVFNEIGATYERVMFHFMRFWVIGLVVCIVTGMLGAGLLGYTFVAGLSR